MSFVRQILAWSHDGTGSIVALPHPRSQLMQSGKYARKYVCEQMASKAM